MFLSSSQKQYRKTLINIKDILKNALKLF